MATRPNRAGSAVDSGGLPVWAPPLIVVVIALAIVAGFYLAGPGLGMALGAFAATMIVVMAVRNPPRRPIVPPAAADHRRHLLVVVGGPLEDDELVEAVAEAAKSEEPLPPEVVLLAPCRNRFLDRWASDFERGHSRAQRDLVLSAASLAKAEVPARARVGDEGIVQSVEDELRSFPASEVILVTGEAERDRSGVAAAKDLRTRLQVPFRHLAPAASARSRLSRQRRAAPERGSGSGRRNRSGPGRRR